MKFRAFLTTLLLFLLTFYASLLIISLFMFNSQMDTAKQRAINEHYVMVSAFSKDLSAISNRGGDLDTSILSLFKFYVEYYKTQDVFLEILKGDQTLYSSVPKQHILPSRSQDIQTGMRYATVENFDDKIYISIIGELPETESQYYFHYLSNISDNILTWKKTQQMLLLIGGAFSILLAIFLQLLLSRLFKPLHQISTASKELAAGNYENRIPISGDDELTEMAMSFNNMADEIQDRMTQLAVAADKKQQFVDNFSHEIRTPLTSIYGYAEYLLKAAVSEKEKFEALEHIMSESRHMLSIADQMLELAALRNQQVSMREVPVLPLFHGTEHSLNLKLKEKQITLEWQSDIDLLYGEPDLLKSLLVNLTDNAMKACEPGGHILWVAGMENNTRFLSVTDDGKGISDEQIEHITEAFYQADKSGKRAKGGVGLGLSICQQIASCHHAILTFESRPNSKTTVKVIFKPDDRFYNSMTSS